MCEAKTAPRALWIESSAASCEANRSLVSAPGEAQRVSNCETSSVLLRTQLRFSHEAKDKALISAISEAAVASLSTAKASNNEARSEEYFGANSEVTSLKERVPHRTKAPSIEIASPHDNVILT